MELLYGASDFDVNNPDLRLVYRRDLRWHRKPATFLLNDFDALLTYLFSEANETNAKYVEEIRHDKERRIELEPPETKLAATKRVWEGVLPHRKLEIGGQGGDAGLWRAWIERLLVQRLGDERRRARDFT